MPEWNKNKGIALLRLGGLSPVRQRGARNIVPELYGIWAFIFPYWDWWFVSGAMTRDKFPKKRVPKHRYPSPRKFFAKGTIYTRMEVPRVAGVRSWFKTNDRELFSLLKKSFSQDIAQLRSSNQEWMSGKLRGEQLARIRHPYKRGLGGYMSVDHMEVFVPRGTKIG